MPQAGAANDQRKPTISAEESRRRAALLRTVLCHANEKQISSLYLWLSAKRFTKLHGEPLLEGAVLMCQKALRGGTTLEQLLRAKKMPKDCLRTALSRFVPNPAHVSQLELAKALIRHWGHAAAQPPVPRPPPAWGIPLPDATAGDGGATAGDGGATADDGGASPAGSRGARSTHGADAGPPILPPRSPARLSALPVPPPPCRQAPLPPCPHGALCYRRNREHRAMFSHPPGHDPNLVPGGGGAYLRDRTAAPALAPVRSAAAAQAAPAPAPAAPAAAAAGVGAVGAARASAAGAIATASRSSSAGSSRCADEREASGRGGAAASSRGGRDGTPSEDLLPPGWMVELRETATGRKFQVYSKPSPEPEPEP